VRANPANFRIADATCTTCPSNTHRLRYPSHQIVSYAKVSFGRAVQDCAPAVFPFREGKIEISVPLPFREGVRG
jgi:hypothetical protein